MSSPTRHLAAGALALLLLAGAAPAWAEPLPSPTADTATEGGPGQLTEKSAQPGTEQTGTGQPTQAPTEATPAGPAQATQPDTVRQDETQDAQNAEMQATMVDQEDQRIIQTRAALTAMLQAGGTEAAQRKQPQVFGSAHGETLVLPARNDERPYTIKDLTAVGNGSYVRKQPDGSYLVGVHIFVADGARLLLRGPLTLRMGSLPGTFSSIVGFGGTIQITGTRKHPVRITSWNVRTKRPDTEPADGRPYIRAIGGAFKMRYTSVSHLGFWSGRTAGIALTGTDRPASAYRHRTKDQRHADKEDRLNRNNEGQGGSNFGDVETTPVGPGTASHVPAEDLVTGYVRNSTITGNAYGLFVSGSNQTQILDNKIRNSLVHGVLLHRFTKNATVARTTVTGSGGDGFVLSRATEKVRVETCVAESNGRNGFTLNGQQLADGPSASGESLAAYGDSSVNGSIARDNGRYGIEILGGSRLAVQTSQVYGGDMGIVVRAHAQGVQISGNRLEGQRRHAIALRDGVKGAYVAGNTIAGAVTGIYMRSSNGTVTGNKVTTAQAPKAHGITVVGDADDTEITRNTLKGAGTSAVSTARSSGDVYRNHNDTDGWKDTSGFWSKAKRYLKPMNLIWAGVILLVVITALRSGGSRNQGTNPYGKQTKLEERPAIELRRKGRRHAPAPVPPRAPARPSVQIPTTVGGGQP
ncbi:right-handed parallel beta-helix repeat-containing protein [Actinocorallia sp. B10E7]|uniref:right-handed parallel beta-helix repeat-containing protein n=1 Tax=Actinocorallia sp. B10E7 TaxID=3153558 RepID=UPI00325C80B5